MAIMATDNAYWLGNIPEDWGISRIGDYYKLRNEKVSDADYSPLSVTMKGIVPQLATAAKTDDHDNRKLVCKGDFAINSRSDRRGSCGISDYDGSVSLINTVLTPRGQMNPRYYNWLFHTEQFADEFYKWGHGIVNDLWTTRWQEMKSILIVSPPLAEQQAIADYLDDRCSKIDEIIAEAAASIEEYKELKQAVIFDAVTKGFDKNVPMKNSGVEWIGEIPTSWDAIRLKYLLTHLIDCPHETPNYVQNGDYYVIRTADQDLGFLRADKNMFRLEKDEYLNRIRRLSLDKDDIVYGREGERWGLACLVLENNKYCLGQRMLHFRCKTNIVVPKFLMWSLNSAGVRMQGVIDTIGSTSPHVNISTVRNFVIPLPDIKKQQEIVNYLDGRVGDINSLILEKQSLIEDLQAYKKSLIYETVTGKRRVV